jgi:chromosome partitioning protein
MKTIAVLSRKGGAGKTTVSLSLAMAARQAGLKVLIADVDPLHSAGEVLNGRPEAQSLLIETTAAKLFVLHDVCRANRYDLLIVDTPPAPEGDVILAINAVDFCLAVARPSALDLAAVQQTLTLVRRMGSSGMVLLNQCPPPATAPSRRSSSTRAKRSSSAACRWRQTCCETAPPISTPSPTGKR